MGYLFFPAILVTGFVCAVWLWAAWTIPHRIRGPSTGDLEQISRNRVGLVLGCTRYLRSGRPNLYFARRIAAAAALHRAGKVERLLVSGASRRGQVDEAQSMKEALLEQGVPADVVVCDHHGYRTLDSVLRARQVFGHDHITVVSQRFHNERAIYIAERRGIEAIGFDARDVAPPRGRAVRFREFFARLRVILDVHVFTTQSRNTGSGEPK